MVDPYSRNPYYRSIFSYIREDYWEGTRSTISLPNAVSSWKAGFLPKARFVDMFWISY